MTTSGSVAGLGRRLKEFALEPYRFDDLEGWQQMLRRLSDCRRDWRTRRRRQSAAPRADLVAGLRGRLLRYLRARTVVNSAVRRAARNWDGGDDSPQPSTDMFDAFEPTTWRI